MIHVPNTNILQRTNVYVSKFFKFIIPVSNCALNRTLKCELVLPPPSSSFSQQNSIEKSNEREGPQMFNNNNNQVRHPTNDHNYPNTPSIAIVDMDNMVRLTRQEPILVDQFIRNTKFSITYSSSDAMLGNSTVIMLTFYKLN